MSEEQTWTIGQDVPGSPADVRVRDPYVSTLHAAVRMQPLERVVNGAVVRYPALYQVRDLGSTNGTWLIGPKGWHHKVGDWETWHPGHTLRIGRTDIPRPS